MCLEMMVNGGWSISGACCDPGKLVMGLLPLTKHTRRYVDGLPGERPRRRAGNEKSDRNEEEIRSQRESRSADRGGGTRTEQNLPYEGPDEPGTAQSLASPAPDEPSTAQSLASPARL